MAGGLYRLLQYFLPEPEMAPAYVAAPAVSASDDGWTLFSDGGSDGKPTVRVTRRRRTTSEPGERERADAPRREDGGGGAMPPSSGGSGASGGHGAPTGGSGASGGRMSLPMLLLLLVVIGVFFLFGRGGDGGEMGDVVEVAATQMAAPQASVQQPAGVPTRAPAAPVAAATAAPGGKWLVMLYQDADDKVLEQDIFFDLNEAERAGSSDAVQIVAQLDRYRGGFAGDGDWTTTKRFYVTQDDDLNAIRSQEVADLGEVNMADGRVLADFVTWAIQTYPADKYALIMSDHGMGWPGGWSDPTASGAYGASAPLEQRLGDHIFLDELDAALAEIRQRTGIDKLELIGLDACLMGHLEVFSALEPHVRYAVASQETEPALGWAYTSFLNELKKNPNVTGKELSQYIVDTYIEDDQRIVDDQARLEFVSGGRGLFSFQAPSASQLAGQLAANITLSAVDLSAMPRLMDSVNALVYEMQQTSQKQVAQARSYAQSFTSIFGSQAPASYIDLGNFAQLAVQATGDGAVSQAAGNLMAALGQAVIAERHGPGKPGALGVSVYFPNSQLYSNPVSGYPSYLKLSSRFAQGSLWDEFLAYHYTGRSFEAAERAAAAPAGEAAVRAPAEGGIQVSAIRASSQTAAPGEPVLLSVDISGENVGYVFAGYYDQAANSVNLTDQDYLESSDTREVDGVYYPVWPEDEFTLEFEWEPIVFAIDDGAQTAAAMFRPQSYGASWEDAIYTVDGIYRYGDGEERSAQLYFRNGALHQVFGFTGEGVSGAPREILPEAGDTFTVLEHWLDLGAQGSAATPATEAGPTLTFGDAPLTWVDQDAAAGVYVVGFIVEDLDGKQYPAYTQITVK